MSSRRRHSKQSSRRRRSSIKKSKKKIRYRRHRGNSMSPPFNSMSLPFNNMPPPNNTAASLPLPPLPLPPPPPPPPPDSSPTTQVFQSEDLAPVVATTSVVGPSDGSLNLDLNLLRTCQPLWKLKDRVVREVRVEVERRVFEMLANPRCSPRDADDAVQITRYMSYDAILDFCRRAYPTTHFLNSNNTVSNYFPVISDSMENNLSATDIDVPYPSPHNYATCEHQLKLSAVLTLSRALSPRFHRRLINVIIMYYAPSAFDRRVGAPPPPFDLRPQSRFVGVGKLLCDVINMYRSVNVRIHVVTRTPHFVLTPMQLAVLDALKTHPNYQAHVVLQMLPTDVSFLRLAAQTPVRLHYLPFYKKNANDSTVEYFASNDASSCAGRVQKRRRGIRKE